MRISCRQGCRRKDRERNLKRGVAASRAEAFAALIRRSRLLRGDQQARVELTGRPALVLALRCDYSGAPLARLTRPPSYHTQKASQSGGSSPHFLRRREGGRSLYRKRGLCVSVQPLRKVTLDSSATHWPRDIVILFLSDASHGRGLQ